jgi:DNA invertase Pin-like site-specific DNA recombinase
MNEGHQKVTGRHLARSAYLYVRQSTMRQVVENTESTERQYALRQRAVALGWPIDSVVVIDSDLGQSGASAVDREGFQKLVAEVGMGRAGIVLGLEVSRLARNSTDWHRLLEICALTDTLILDEDGIYDPAHFNDRLLLGLKGTMSEAELHVLSARLRGGLIHKARRGELRCRLPIGFVYDTHGRVVFDPDTQVQESVRLFFQTFHQTGAAHATIKSFRTQALLFPTRVAAGPRTGELVWGPLSLGRATSILHSPWYAGAYAFGRSRHRKQLDGKARRTKLPTNYVCVGRGRLFGDPLCQSIVGTQLDAAIGELIVGAVTPKAIELTLAVHQEIQRRVDDTDRLRHRQVERAQYEVDLARQRYLHVDPANRLVADSLETDWNAKLRLLEQARDDYQRQRTADRLIVDDEQRRRVLALATEFPAVWRDPSTPDRERKRMLALLIEDVTLIKQHQITAAVRFRGGDTTTLTLPRPLTAQQLRATHAEVRQQIDVLLNDYFDAQIAHILNERGLHTGAGEAFDAVSVQWVRSSAKLPSLKQRLIAAGMLTTRQLGEMLGVKRTTLSRWRKQSLIEGRICNELGEWLYWPPKQFPPHPQPTTATPATPRTA